MYVLLVYRNFADQDFLRYLFEARGWNARLAAGFHAAMLALAECQHKRRPFPRVIIAEHPLEGCSCQEFLENAHFLGFQGSVVWMSSSSMDTAVVASEHVPLVSRTVRKPLFWNDLVRELDTLLSSFE